MGFAPAPGSMIGRRNRTTRPLAALAAIFACCGVTAAGAAAHETHGDTDPLLGESTLDHTVIGTDQNTVDDGGPGDEFTFLRIGPGEPYLVREDLAPARGGRDERRRSLIYLAQLTDFQLADEESPARVEFLDPSGGAVSSAWRPQEALVPLQVEHSIRQVNRFRRSPVPQGDGRRARMVNSVLTGDLADNMQLNETRWVIELLEGGTFVDGERVSSELDPNTGSAADADYASAAGCPPAGPDREALKAEAPGYTGVQDYDDYPPSAIPGADNEDFWDPDQPAGQYAAWPSYTGLMDRAQQPFEVQGLGVPSYVAFGNHDALVQGNQWANQGFDEIARGCVKAFPAPGALAFLEELLGGVGLAAALRDDEALEAALDLGADSHAGPLEEFQMLVPPDPDRRLIDRPTFKQLHDTGFQEDAHGFALVDEAELEASRGAASYYDFSPEPGVRYVILDTVSNGGQFPDSSSGNIDHPQFQWLERVLARSERRDEIVLVFAHHAIGSLSSNVPDEAAPPCTQPSPGPGCDLDPRDSRKPGTLSPHLGADLEALLLDRPNVIALIAGHSHENRIEPYSGGGGRFWEIKSPAIVDWPPQHRLIEVMDNRDGTLSIFGTMLDDGSAARAPGPEVGVNAMTGEMLASLGRTIAFNDPQVGPGDGSQKGPQGYAEDRNVELLIRDPRDPRAGDKSRRCAGKRATIVGTRGDDRIRGTRGRDVIVAGRGDDRIAGRGGRDLICTGPGDDVVRGGGGADRIRGGRGADRMRGGAGDDELRGGPGPDKLRGGRGADSLRGGPGRDVLRGGKGRDILRGGPGADRLFGGPGRDVLRGGKGRDVTRN